MVSFFSFFYFLPHSHIRSIFFDFSHLINSEKHSSTAGNTQFFSLYIVYLFMLKSSSKLHCYLPMFFFKMQQPSINFIKFCENNNKNMEKNIHITTLNFPMYPWLMFFLLLTFINFSGCI